MNDKEDHISTGRVQPIRVCKYCQAPLYGCDEKIEACHKCSVVVMREQSKYIDQLTKQMGEMVALQPRPMTMMMCSGCPNRSQFDLKPGKG